MVIEIYDQAIIRDLTYILEETDDHWLVHSKIYLETGTTNNIPLKGELSVELVGISNKLIRIIELESLESGEITKTISFPVSKVYHSLVYHLL